MNNDDWMDLPSFEAVALAMSKGWEIEVLDTGSRWTAWSKSMWRAAWRFRGRPAQPKTTRKVKLLGWMSDRGFLYLLDENEECNRDWNRVPGEDKTVWVQE